MNVVPAGLEPTIFATSSVGCSVTCAKLTKSRRKNTIIKWRIMGPLAADSFFRFPNPRPHYDYLCHNHDRAER